MIAIDFSLVLNLTTSATKQIICHSIIAEFTSISTFVYAKNIRRTLLRLVSFNFNTIRDKNKCRIKFFSRLCLLWPGNNLQQFRFLARCLGYFSNICLSSLKRFLSYLICICDGSPFSRRKTQTQPIAKMAAHFIIAVCWTLKRCFDYVLY